MFVVHGTKKFRDRIRVPACEASGLVSTTVLGPWYAKALLWRPQQVALFVNEPTLLPVLLPLAPAATVFDRFRRALASVLVRQGVDEAFIDRELEEMDDYQVAKTSNRSLLGMLNEFSFMVETRRAHDDDVDLVDFAMWLARTPCGPLRDRHGFPDRELAALVTSHTTQPPAP